MCLKPVFAMNTIDDFTILIAADSEYPFNDPASAGMRRKFNLPPDRTLNA